MTLVPKLNAYGLFGGVVILFALTAMLIDFRGVRPCPEYEFNNACHSVPEQQLADIWTEGPPIYEHQYASYQ